MIYLDYSATTPPDERVLKVYFESLRNNFTNPNATYDGALNQRISLENARKRFAQQIGADEREIIFTSGATEANNLAIKGAVSHHEAKNPRIITLQTEHKAVLDPVGILAKNGVKTEFLPVQSSGLLDLDLLEQALQTPTTLVSVMAVNNETGVMQNLPEIAKLAHQYGAKFHIDASQALGKIPVNVRHWDADAVSFSGHKVYAPVGIGALFVRRLPKMRLNAQQHGGGQERGLRSGTVPVGLISAFAEALFLAHSEYDERIKKISALNQYFIENLPEKIRRNIIENKVPHLENIAIPVAIGEALERANEAGLALSAGSACQSGGSASHVLTAMGITAPSLRISLSHLTTEADIEALLNFLKSL